MKGVLLFPRKGLIVAVVASVVILTLASPFALAIIGIIGNPDWRHLGDIGQTYGVASAVLSALAVVGVAASLLYQARALRLASLDSFRKTHRELLNLILEDPDTYLPALGFKWWQRGEMSPKQFYFITMFFGYIHIGYDTKVLHEEDIRMEFLPSLFSGELGRKWWSVSRDTWLSSKDPTMRQLGRVTDSEYGKAVAAGEPLPEAAFVPAREEASTVDGASGHGGSTNRTILVLGSAAAGVAAGWLASHVALRRRP